MQCGGAVWRCDFGVAVLCGGAVFSRFSAEKQSSQKRRREHESGVGKINTFFKNGSVSANTKKENTEAAAAKKGQMHRDTMLEPLMLDSETSAGLSVESRGARRQWPVAVTVVAVGFTKVTSAVCSFLFIGFIFQFAVVHYVYHRYYLREAGRVWSAEEGYTEAYPVAPEGMRVTGDLGYYAQLLGLRLDEYEATTEDGFVITVQRLRDPKHGPDTLAGGTLRPVLLVHGLMQSSGSFVTGGYKSLAYLLVQNGYDVWLGNNRCGFRPRHTHYGSNDPRMWDWDLHEMSQYDLPAMLRQIRAVKTNYAGKVSLVAHSQGTTQTVILISGQHRHPCAEDIDKCVLLAPAVYGGPLLNSKLFIKFMRFLPDGIYESFFGMNSFMPILMYLRQYTYKLPAFGLTSYMVFSYLFDWNDYLWDVRLRRYHFIFSPVFVSVKLMKWWLRSKHGRGFSTDKPIIDDPNAWFTKSTPDIFLVIGGKDDLVNGDLFVDRLERLEPDMTGRWSYVKVPEYSHLDVLWADDLLDRVGDALLEFLAT